MDFKISLPDQPSTPGQPSFYGLREVTAPCSVFDLKGHAGGLEARGLEAGGLETGVQRLGVQRPIHRFWIWVRTHLS